VSSLDHLLWALLGPPLDQSGKEQTQFRLAVKIDLVDQKPLAGHGNEQLTKCYESFAEYVAY
jgi:hypothetical protein